MTYTASYGFGPGNTPKPIQNLIAITCIITLLSAFANNIFTHYLETQGPQFLLSLSWRGLKQWYIWQPLSYLFVQSNGDYGISLPFLIELLFNMYIVWIMGTAIYEKVGSSSFFRFYFIIGISVGLITLLFLPTIGPHQQLAGPTAVVLAIMTVWTMLHPESELLLFFILPVKAKWILVGIIAAILLINLSTLQFIPLLFSLLGLLGGYLYATIAWGLESPFSFTRLLDRFLASLGSKIRHLVTFAPSDRSTTMSVEKNAKIFDFHTGKAILDDDLFMDSILEKISKYGEKSLTWSERNRMKKISDRKSRRKR